MDISTSCSGGKRPFRLRMPLSLASVVLLAFVGVARCADSLGDTTIDGLSPPLPQPEEQQQVSLMRREERDEAKDASANSPTLTSGAETDDASSEAAGDEDETQLNHQSTLRTNKAGATTASDSDASPTAAKPSGNTKSKATVASAGKKTGGHTSTKNGKTAPRKTTSPGESSKETAEGPARTSEKSSTTTDDAVEKNKSSAKDTGDAQAPSATSKSDGDAATSNSGASADSSSGAGADSASRPAEEKEPDFVVARSGDHDAAHTGVGADPAQAGVALQQRAADRAPSETEEEAAFPNPHWSTKTLGSEFPDWTPVNQEDTEDIEEWETKLTAAERRKIAVQLSEAPPGPIGPPTGENASDLTNPDNRPKLVVKHGEHTNSKDGGITKTDKEELIQVFSDPSKCMDVAISADFPLGTVVTAKCEETLSNQRWITPENGAGAIRWAINPDRCLTGVEQKFGPAKLEILLCKPDKEDSQIFIVGDGKVGAIQWGGAKASEKQCVDMSDILTDPPTLYLKPCISLGDATLRPPDQSFRVVPGNWKFKWKWQPDAENEGDADGELDVAGQSKYPKVLTIPAGELGKVGHKGKKGVVGLPGKAGVDASPGPKGPTGQQGEQGEQGDQGDIGPPGPPPETPREFATYNALIICAACNVFIWLCAHASLRAKIWRSHRALRCLNMKVGKSGGAGSGADAGALEVYEDDGPPPPPDDD